MLMLLKWQSLLSMPVVHLHDSSSVASMYRFPSTKPDVSSVTPRVMAESSQKTAQAEKTVPFGMT